MSLPRKLCFRCCGLVQDLQWNGNRGTLGCAAATLNTNGDARLYEDELVGFVTEMTGGAHPTSDRAGVMAVVGSLQWAYNMIEQALEDQLAPSGGFDGNEDYSRPGRPTVTISIKSDSRYAMDGVTNCLPLWSEHEFTTSGSTPVSNQDLWIDVVDLQSSIAKLADAEYEYE